MCSTKLCFNISCVISVASVSLTMSMILVMVVTMSNAWWWSFDDNSHYRHYHVVIIKHLTLWHRKFSVMCSSKLCFDTYHNRLVALASFQHVTMTVFFFTTTGCIWGWPSALSGCHHQATSSFLLSHSSWTCRFVQCFARPHTQSGSTCACISEVTKVRVCEHLKFWWQIKLSLLFHSYIRSENQPFEIVESSLLFKCKGLSTFMIISKESNRHK